MSGWSFEVNRKKSETGTGTAKCIRSDKVEAHGSRRLGGYSKSVIVSHITRADFVTQ